MRSIDSFLMLNNKYLRGPREDDRIFSKGKKIEVVYAIVSKGIPLFRTEGVGDITLLEVKVKNTSYSVPAILPEKIQAKMRRQMLEILRSNFSKKIREEYIPMYRDELGFVKIGSDNSWKCFVAPPKGEEETDIGMCGFCPACNTFGAIITTMKEIKIPKKDKKTSTYGLKSRVVHDVAFAATRYECAVIDLTHNKVGDGVSYTGVALFEESHVVPGVVFVGKLSMFDVTEREAKLILSALLSITRMGGGETKYGSVQVVLIGLKGGDRETVSSYDIVRRILEKNKGELVEPEEVIRDIAHYVTQNKGFTKVIDENKMIDEEQYGKLVDERIIEQIWGEDNYYYAKSVVDLIKKVEGAKATETSEEKKSEKTEDQGKRLDK